MTIIETLPVTSSVGTFCLVYHRVIFWGGSGSPTAHQSDGPFVRQPISPTTHQYDSPLFRQPISPTCQFVTVRDYILHRITIFTISFLFWFSFFPCNSSPRLYESLRDVSQLGNRKIVRSGGTYMCTCMFNYLLSQLGMGTTITRNKTKRNSLMFLVTLKTLRFRFVY